MGGGDDLAYFASGLSRKNIQKKSSIMLRFQGLADALQLITILMEPFSMIITHCSEVWKEEVEVGVKKVNFE